MLRMHVTKEHCTTSCQQMSTVCVLLVNSAWTIKSCESDLLLYYTFKVFMWWQLLWLVIQARNSDWVRLMITTKRWRIWLGSSPTSTQQLHIHYNLWYDSAIRTHLPLFHLPLLSVDYKCSHKDLRKIICIFLCTGWFMKISPQSLEQIHFICSDDWGEIFMKQSVNKMQIN